MNNSILLYDDDPPLERILGRLHSVFDFRVGIYSPLKRLRKLHPEDSIFYYHPDPVYEQCICRQKDLFSWREVHGHDNDQPAASDLSSVFARVHYASDLKLMHSLDQVADTIIGDLSAWFKTDKLRSVGPGSGDYQCIGSEKDLHIHNRAQVLPGVIFNTSAGPIIIDREASISPHSYLQGPLYIGKGARLDNVRIGGACSVGKQVRLGGEIENSIIQDYSNKHHDGFLGHSLIGRWVNMGAMATTSDLKNNYGQVHLQIPSQNRPRTSADAANWALQETSTNTIKFGSVIADCVKIAIGTMINTGTVIDAGCNVFGQMPAKYMAPLSWGRNGVPYDKERFKQDARTIFERRDHRASSAFDLLVDRLTAEQGLFS
ncbi:MAG: glucose-1-phosphate thymidylyltransferase [Leptospiraceae bacterium]|nr:glucose-1-phosphate thymidylyltransferase [Leptospiraceae bacterium]